MSKDLESRLRTALDERRHRQAHEDARRRDQKQARADAEREAEAQLRKFHDKVRPEMSRAVRWANTCLATHEHGQVIQVQEVSDAVDVARRRGRPVPNLQYRMYGLLKRGRPTLVVSLPPDTAIEVRVHHPYVTINPPVYEESFVLDEFGPHHAGEVVLKFIEITLALPLE